MNEDDFKKYLHDKATRICRFKNHPRFRTLIDDFNQKYLCWRTAYDEAKRKAENDPSLWLSPHDKEWSQAEIDKALREGFTPLPKDREGFQRYPKSPSLFTKPRPGLELEEMDQIEVGGQGPYREGAERHCWWHEPLPYNPLAGLIPISTWDFVTGFSGKICDIRTDDPAVKAMLLAVICDYMTTGGEILDWTTEPLADCYNRIRDFNLDLSGSAEYRRGDAIRARIEQFLEVVEGITAAQAKPEAEVVGKQATTAEKDHFSFLAEATIRIAGFKDRPEFLDLVGDFGRRWKAWDTAYSAAREQAKQDSKLWAKEGDKPPYDGWTVESDLPVDIDSDENGNLYVGFWCPPLPPNPLHCLLPDFRTGVSDSTIAKRKPIDTTEELVSFAFLSAAIYDRWGSGATVFAADERGLIRREIEKIVGYYGLFDPLKRRYDPKYEDIHGMTVRTKITEALNAVEGYIQNAASKVAPQNRPDKKLGMPIAEVNVRVREILKPMTPKEIESVTCQKLADEIGCSKSTVSQTGAWKAVMEQRSRTGRKAKEVSMTDGIQYVAGVEDESLKALIEDQAKDAEEDGRKVKLYHKQNREKPVDIDNE